MLIFQFYTLKAQKSIAIFKSTNDTIVWFYNNGNLEVIYERGSDVFKQNESKENFTSFLQHLKSETGNITSVPLGVCGDRAGFKWTGENKNLRVEWKTTKSGAFDDYFINDLIEQPYSKKLLTDNKLNSYIDKLVNKYVTYYMQNEGAVGLSIGIIKDGKKYMYNYGEQKKGTRQLPTTTSIYELGSVAKTFIATLLAQASPTKSKKDLFQ